MGRKGRRYVSSLLVIVMTTVFCLGNSALSFVSAADNRKIDVWDFGGVQETNTDLYTNNITLAAWESCTDLVAGKFTVIGTKAFGDLAVKYEKDDRVYAIGIKNANASRTSSCTTAYADGYTANGQYYCNGKGSIDKRTITIANVVAGDKVVVYMAAQSLAADCVMHFSYTDALMQDDTTSYTNTGTKYEFVAKYSGTYKIYTDTNSVKPIYNRVVRIPGVAVSGSINLGSSSISGYTVKFTNDKTGAETEATLNGTNFSAILAPGDTYTASLNGATGFGFTNASKVVTPDVSEVISGKNGVSLKVESKSIYNFTGKITGFNSSYDISKLVVTLETPTDSLFEDVALKINADLTFTAQLSPDVPYTVKLGSVNDYEVVSGGTVNSNVDVAADINVSTKALYAVTGGFKDLPSGKSVTAVTFTNVDDSYVYTGTTTATGYSVNLRDGSYSVKATVDGYTTNTHIVVSGAAVSKDLLFVAVDKTVVPITRVSDVYVGYSNKANNYATVNAAIAACKAMNPTIEADRITVHIAPGTYREQVIISTPYISLVNDEQGQVLLTWYYGIGYTYFSADSTGYYNAESAYDQYNEKTVAKWGCSTYIQNTATGFKAENITFEASFNRYITDEEIVDGVTASGESINFARKYGADVTAKTATERATAMAVDADKVEFYNCSFLGGQDTLYTSGTNTSSYYKDCFIEGNTDFIFGDGNAVFDACNISWKGYSDTANAGYLTAAKDVATYGYLFRNCTVTGNDKLKVAGGAFGRPWGANAKVKFINTKLESADLISDVGWADMSGALATGAKFGEYNTTVLDGTTEDTSKRVTGVMDATAASAINVTNYFGTWVPSHYTAEDAAVALSATPSLTDNGDINAPYPGHTLTVHYSLGAKNDLSDASTIRWYRVNATTGVETLAKVSSASAGNSYTITTADQGFLIKVVVIPESISGTVGASKSYQADAFVRTGYEDPTATGGDIVLGDGVNIFLAGDSTVKDYSTAGMYMSGKAQSEGSWGEYLQSFFDSKVVKIQNYANGGRSTRNFINEGSLDKISAKITTGDYLLIQFGHNDCANSSGYLADRYVPLGTPDANGIFPVTAGAKVDNIYTYDCGATYKWYLLQYINAVKAAGATPVLVTPVSRQYYNADGTIKPHHDSTDTTTGTYVSSNDAYVTAMKQLAVEQNVLLIDAFQLTKNMYQAAYTADSTAANGVSTYGKQVMAPGDSTHSNKLGGLISAAYMATTIQSMNLNISSAIQKPSQIAGETGDGKQVFSINGNNQLTAFASDDSGNFTVSATYWQTLGQTLITAIGNYTAPVIADADYTAVTAAKTAVNILTAADYKDFSAVTAAVAAVQTGLKVTDQTKVDAMAKAINDAIAALVKVVPAAPSTIWMVGDSTVCGFTDNYYYPRYGWGTQLGNYLDGSFTIQNLALSGRSSTSYTLDPQYQTLLTGMKSGDFLFIGFGHNDEKAEAARYTNPNGSYTEAGSFANSLYENYIKQAKAAGVTVVLCTPIVRRTATGIWSDSNLHITTTIGTFPGGDYSKSIKDLGTALSIPVVDMTSLTKSLYDTLGAAETLYLHAWTSSKEASVDNTHTNIWGAKYNAYLITKALKGLNVSGLSSHVIDAVAPTKVGNLVSNPLFVESGYTGQLTDSLLWPNLGIWKGTVFGNVGGLPSATNQKLEADSNGNMHIAVTGDKGKIASAVDGFAMYYYKVPANSTFTLSAKAKINAYASNDQVSFGLMARDEMYIDSLITTAIGDYVVAGPLKLTKVATPTVPGSIWNCFARKSGVLTQGGTCANAIAVGDTLNLKIEGNSDGYACTLGNETTIAGGFDFKLTSIDSNYVYVGMFVARNADITFSDIKLIVDGVEVVATTDPGTNPGTEVAADYSAVTAALEAAKALIAADYKDFSAVTTAVNAVQTGLLTADQAKVDAMAKAITDAVAGLVNKVVVLPAEIVASNNQIITSSQILDVIKTLTKDQDLLIDVTKGSVNEISSDVFKAAAQMNSTVVIKVKDCTWEFSNLSADTTVSLKSPVVTIDAKIAAVTDKLATAAGFDTSKVVQLSFEHSGALPGEAKVTLNVKGKYDVGTTLHFYYFNAETGLFESLQTCTVDADGNVVVTLTHCSDYVFTIEELPQTLIVVANPVIIDTNVSNTSDPSVKVATGDSTPIVGLFCLFILSAGVVLTVRRKRLVVK
ncbi:pectinesterase family protein [[Clostridium] fimetarium]|uniref:GDSL-like Lipase/Acylhydrolase family protein n=1 Tax=[Clostridium] fimetarium TaxID=99656 RepID=A0A1I0RKC1_9FIRM|nr:pectinesterase family protein [[Clostridium] fimetarium]SEW41257.1 GDSL-like Lipase/Acylhydrolase family protein [[Clostridium] fimetarium]